MYFLYHNRDNFSFVYVLLWIKARGHREGFGHIWDQNKCRSLHFNYIMVCFNWDCIKFYKNLFCNNHNKAFYIKEKTWKVYGVCVICNIINYIWNYYLGTRKNISTRLLYKIIYKCFRKYWNIAIRQYRCNY